MKAQKFSVYILEIDLRYFTGNLISGSGNNIFK